MAGSIWIPFDAKRHLVVLISCVVMSEFAYFHFSVSFRKIGAILGVFVVGSLLCALSGFGAGFCLGLEVVGLLCSGLFCSISVTFVWSCISASSLSSRDVNRFFVATVVGSGLPVFFWRFLVTAW